MGNMTATIVWNLITSYVKGDAWYGDSFMEASNPWSGSYSIKGPLWIVAHTTQVYPRNTPHSHSVCTTRMELPPKRNRKRFSPRRRFLCNSLTPQWHRLLHRHRNHENRYIPLPIITLNPYRTLPMYS
jgi:hypothetical protein